MGEKPIKVLFDPDGNVPAEKEMMGRGKKLAMRFDSFFDDIHPDGLGKRYLHLEDGTTFTLKRGEAENKVIIYVPSGGEWVLEEEQTMSDEIVPILELSSSPSSHVLAGFVAFGTQGEGYPPETITEEVNWGKIIGWTNKIRLDENKDIPGLFGGTTIRTGWCLIKSNITKIIDENTRVEEEVSIEQIKRVDQGWTAYDEGTMLNGSEDVWIYYSQYYESTIDWENYQVDPGPPPYDICGYTWAPDGSEDEWQTRYLFYGIQRPGAPGMQDPYVWWWPPEFNQHITYQSHYYTNCFLSTNYDESLNEPDWGDYYDLTGMLASPLGPYILEESWGENFYTYYYDHRLWGIIWGSEVFGLEDDTANDYPYTAPIPRTIADEVAMTPYYRWFDTTGVYVHNGNPKPDYWISGSQRFSGYYYEESFWNIWEREEQDPDERIASESMANLTDRARELMQGNEDYGYSPPFTYDVWSGFYETGENFVTWNFPVSMIFCGSNEFYCGQAVADPTSYQWGAATVYVSGFITGDWWDYGIFTKNRKVEGKNLTADQVKTDIDPVYVYSFTGPEDDTQIRFGIVRDDRQFISEWYELDQPIPGLDGVAEDGSALYLSEFIRAGRYKKTKKTYRRVRRY